MKNIVILLLSIIVLGGCRKSEFDITPDPASYNVTFNAMVDGQTKAVTDVNFDTYGIYIAGYHTTGNMLEAVTKNVNAVFPNVFDADPSDNQASVPLVKKATSGEHAGKYVTKTVKLGLEENTYLGYYSWAQNKAQDIQNGIIAATKSSTDKGYPWLDIRNANLQASQVDIVAARSVDKLNDRVVSAVDLNFEHILSKLTFSITSSSQINIVFSKIDLVYGANKIYSRGKYTFNSDPARPIGTFGGYSEYHTGSHSYGALTLVNGGQVKLGDLLLVPQNAPTGFLVFNLEYKIPNGATFINQTRSVEIPATDLQMGRNHIFTLDVTLDKILVRKSTIDFWNTESDMLPIVMGPKGDVLLHLDGFDQPYEHIDGKFYWLDRSGYNRHVKLTDGYKGWNRTDHYYDFATTQTTGVGGEIPALGSVSDISMSIITEMGTTPSDGNSVPIKFFNTTSATPAIWPSISKTNSARIDLSRGDGLGANAVTVNYTDLAQTKIKKIWTFQLSANKWLIYDNYINKLSQAYSGSATVGDLIRGQLAIEGFVGKISYVKVTKKITTQSEINDEFIAANRRYGIDLPLPTGVTLVGNFAGKMVNKAVGNEAWYYFDRQLYAADANESTSMVWGPSAVATSITDKINGRANTKALYTLGSDYVSATACYDKTSGGVMASTWYLPSQGQLQSMWIAKPALASLSTMIASSNEFNVNTDYWYVDFALGSTQGTAKTNSRGVRCVADSKFLVGNPAGKVVRDNLRVYIDVQDMPTGTWNATTLNTAHIETSATNSLYSRFEIARKDGNISGWDAAKSYCTGLSGSGWRLPTQRELMLMWVLKDGLMQAGLDPFMGDGYWSNTEYYSVGGSNSWYVSLSVGGSHYYEKSYGNSVRCVREV